MADQSIDTAPPAPRVSIWPHVATAALILGFISAGWLRLNDCDLFNPDSPRYVIYAQSIADSGQYRATDTPGAPLYTWRPPGLPLLLAPVLRALPYDVVASKCVVLTTAALLLLVVHAIASSRGPWFGPVAVAVVGSSPLFLSLSTEVLTEVPYALGILAALYGIGCWDQSTGRYRWLAYALALCALAYTPIIRTVGVALIAAVGLWSLSTRRRWRFVPAVIASIGSVGWLAWRNRQAQGSNYAGSLLQSIQEQGLGKVIADAVGTLAFYGSAFPGVLLPGMTSEQPFYAPMVVGALPTWNGGVLATAITLTVIALCGIGLWHERARGGIAGLLYVLLYCVCLAIWPWRHERFLWPLVPLIWAYVPAGCSLIGSLLPQRVRLSSALACGAAILGLCGWQSRADLSLISTNQRFLANRESFYRETAPGFYFSDWRQAGRWLNENSPPHARVLTWQAALGGTAHRYQRRVQFEAQSPEKVRQGIAAFPARYVVVTTAQFGLGFGWRQVYADPAYSFTVVYHDRDVAILEIGPNRSGEISRTGYDDWLQRQQHELDEFLARSPGRTDLIARKADLLQEQGDNAQAIAILQELVGNGVVTVRVCSSLGWLYFAEGQYDKAAYYLDLAKGLPNAEPVAESLADGARRARERLNAPAANTEDQAVERSLRKISAMVASLNLLNAEREADACLQRSPDHPELNYWRGYLHHLAGERDQAEARYLRAAGSKPADEKLLLIRLERALAQTAAGPIKLEGSEESIEPNSFAAHVRLAKLYDEHGWSGRALATLEAAQQRFGNHPEIQSPLAELNLRFARPAEAAALYRQAQQAWPHDKSLRQGLAVAEAAQRIPTMVQAGRKSVTTNLANDHKK